MYGIQWGLSSWVPWPEEELEADQVPVRPRGQEQPEEAGKTNTSKNVSDQKQSVLEELIQRG